MKECPVCHRCFADRVNHCPGDGDALKFLLAGEPVLDGRYQLEQKIGHGGMGMVFKARHVHLKTTHAVKVILPDLVGNDPTLTTRFRQEAMAAAAIRHPHTVSVTDYGVVNETMPYLVMEFVEGRSLHDLLAEQRRLPPALAVEIMLAVCEGVAAAHRIGIVHRDLKPLNILLKDGASPRDGVKVLDFGLAKIKSGELLGSFVAAQTQGLMGSPYYMAPEQWSDEGVDERADIYSLGVLLYQMVAGDVPFKGTSIPSIMNKHLTAAPVPFAERGVEVPPAVEGVVRHALEKEPDKRPPTVEAFMVELRAALATLNGSAAQPLVGTQTVQLGPQPTMELPDHRGAVTGREPRPDEESLKTIVVTRERARTSALETEGGARTVAEPSPSEALTEALPASADLAPGPDTTRQRAERTTFDGPHASPSVKRVADDAMTAPLPASVNLHGAQTRTDEEAAPPAQAAPQAAPHAARAAHVPHGAVHGAAHGTAQPTIYGAAQSVARSPDATTRDSSRLPLLAGGVVLLLFLSIVGGLAYYFATRGVSDADSAESNTNAGMVGSAGANTGANANAGAGEASATRAEMVSLPGGSFRVGRDDVPPLTEEARRTRPTYLLWMYQQWPAHSVNVAPFAIDKTEVTNEEYAAFVREEGYPAPSTWGGDAPTPGFERMPVTGVSYEDARAFAAWRSRRDGVTYRLPTEEEWEYAARGGDAARLFPWGARWAEGHANLAGAGPAPVGSFALGVTPQGVADMIGNVWELTGSEAKMYEGNDQTVLNPTDRAKVVARGGSYESRPDGEEPLTATSRRWVAKDFRSPVLGFRLVRPGR
jgi:serine/threonine-protein kinase